MDLKNPTPAAELSTRVIYADELAVGMTLVEPCEGYFPSGRDLQCSSKASEHRDRDRHEFTINRIRHGGYRVNLVVTDEDGEQQGWSGHEAHPVRVKV